MALPDPPSEYGPYPYSLYRPNTNILLGDQWEVNNFVRNHIAESFKESISISGI
jgi:hypothetical protein